VSDMGVQIKIDVDAEAGRAHLERFERAFDATMRKMGRTDADIAFIKQLSADVDRGKIKIGEIDAKWRSAVETFRRGATGVRLIESLGLEQHADIKARIEEIRRSFVSLQQSGAASSAELAQASRVARERVTELSSSIQDAGGASGGMADAVGRVQVALAAITSVVAGGGFVRLADEMVLLSGRLRLSEGSAQAAGERLTQLNAIARAMQVDIAAAGESYIRFARAIRAIGGDTQDALAFTESLGLALRVSGASAEEASGVMRQLSQAMAKGRLQGDEFVTVSEAGSRVLDYLADALKVTRGELLRMATDGELTAEKLLKLNTQIERIRQDAAALPQTVGGAWQELTNATKMWVNESEGAGIVTRGLIAIMQGLAEHLETVVNAIALIGGAAILANLHRLAGVFERLRNIATFAAGLHPVARGLMLAGGAAVVAWEGLQRLRGGVDGVADSARRIGDARVALDTLSGSIVQAVGNIRTAMDAARQGMDSAVKQMTSGARAVQDALAGALTQRTGNIDAALRTQLAAITHGATSERDQIRATTTAHVEAARQKVAATDQAGREMLAVWAQTSRTQIEAARAAGTGAADAERQSVEDRRRILDTLAAHYRSIADQLIAETNRHLEAARRAAEERANFNLSLEDRIRALRQRGMSEAEAYADRLRQIDEKQAQARAALQEGDFARARKLAEQAISLAESSARQVTTSVEQNGKRVTQVIVSEAQASATAIGKIGEAGKIVNAALQGMEAESRRAAAQTAAAYDEVKRKLAEVQGQVDRLAAQQVKTLTLQVKANVDEVNKRIEEVRQLAAAKEIMLTTAIDIDKARAALESATQGQPLSIEAQAKLDKAAEAIQQLRAAQANDPLKLFASIDVTKPEAAIARLREPTGSVHTVQPNTAQAQAAIAQLQRPTSSIHTVHVQQVQARAAGGLVESIARFAGGGQAFRRHMPGLLRGPGTATSDSIPALVSNGEYIIRAASVRKYGRALLDAINAGLYAPTMRFAAGGGLPGVAASASDGNAETVNINLTVGERKIALQGARDQAMALAGALRELSRGGR